MTFEDRFVRVLGDGLGDTGSACDCSGEAEVAARLSRSSKRRFSFLPVGLRRVRNVALGWDLSFFFFLTIVALGDTVLDAPTLCEVRDLGPVLVWVGVWAECAAVAVTTTRA